MHLLHRPADGIYDPNVTSAVTWLPKMACGNDGLALRERDSER